LLTEAAEPPPVRHQPLPARRQPPPLRAYSTPSTNNRGSHPCDGLKSLSTPLLANVCVTERRGWRKIRQFPPPPTEATTTPQFEIAYAKKQQLKKK